MARAPQGVLGKNKKKTQRKAKHHPPTKPTKPVNRRREKSHLFEERVPEGEDQSKRNEAYESVTVTRKGKRKAADNGVVIEQVRGGGDRRGEDKDPKGGRRSKKNHNISKNEHSKSVKEKTG